MANETTKKNEVVENEEAAPAEVEQKTKEEKVPLRKRLGARLMSDEPILSPKVKKVAAIVGGGIMMAGAAIGGIALKEHLGSDAGDDPAGLLTEGEQPFELQADDYVVTGVDQA